MGMFLCCVGVAFEMIPATRRSATRPRTLWLLREVGLSGSRPAASPRASPSQALPLEIGKFPRDLFKSRQEPTPRDGLAILEAFLAALPADGPGCAFRRGGLVSSMRWSSMCGRPARDGPTVRSRTLGLSTWHSAASSRRASRTIHVTSAALPRPRPLNYPAPRTIHAAFAATRPSDSPRGIPRRRRDSLLGRST